MKKLNEKKTDAVTVSYLGTVIVGSGLIGWAFGKAMRKLYGKVMDSDWMYDEVDDDGNVVKKVEDDWEYDENGNRILEVDDGRIIFEKYDKEDEEGE